MKKMTALVLMMMLLPSVLAQPATAAAENEVVWAVKDCHETAVVLPSKGLPRGDLLVALAYRCDEATVGGTKLAKVSVSEISVLHADFTWTLLRQVTDSEQLHDGLRALGVKDSFLGKID